MRYCSFNYESLFDEFYKILLHHRKRYVRFKRALISKMSLLDSFETTSIYIIDKCWLVADNSLKSLLDCRQCKNINVSLKRKIYSLTSIYISSY
jgi:hypothetical protein